MGKPVYYRGLVVVSPLIALCVDTRLLHCRRLSLDSKQLLPNLEMFDLLRTPNHTAMGRHITRNWRLHLEVLPESTTAFTSDTGIPG